VLQCVLQCDAVFCAVFCSVVHHTVAQTVKGNGEKFIEGVCCGVVRCSALQSGAVCVAVCVAVCCNMCCVLLQCVAVLYTGRVPESSKEMVSCL